MEQSLGKNIAAKRKSLGMTQDQLAERLGVTAQAVSKWENDQSCPDITMLPKLAEIFHTTTDALLGLESAKVHEAEVVNKGSDSSDDLHIHFENDKGSGWEFRWDHGRRIAVGFAVFVLLVGLLTLADSYFCWDANFWDLCWPSALLVFGLTSLSHKAAFMSISCALLGGYFMLKHTQLLPFQLDGDMIFPILIVIFGISLLLDALRKPKKPRFKLIHKGSKDKQHSQCDITGETFDCTMSFGEETRYIQLPKLTEGDISVCFGDYTIDLTGCETVSDNCQLDVSCAFGDLTLLVPSRFRIEPDTTTSFGNFEVEGDHDSQPEGLISLDASVCFGQITVKYI